MCLSIRQNCENFNPNSRSPIQRRDPGRVRSETEKLHVRDIVDRYPVSNNIIRLACTLLWGICPAVPEGVFVIRERKLRNAEDNVNPNIVPASWTPRPASCPDEKRTAPSVRPDRSSAIIEKRKSYQIHDRPPSTRTRREEGSVRGCPPGLSYAPVSRTFKDDDDRPRRSVRSKQREHAPASRRWRATIIRTHSVSSTTRPTRRPSPQVSLSAVYASIEYPVTFDMILVVTRWLTRHIQSPDIFDLSWRFIMGIFLTIQLPSGIYHAEFI